MDIDQVKKGFVLLEQGMRVLGSGPLDYYVKRLVECYELLIERFAPFHVGDIVMLTKAPDIKPDSGWNGSRHFLVQGAIGKVCRVDCTARGFGADVMFDDESWLKDGVPQPVKIEDRHTYYMREEELHRLGRR